MSQTKTQLIDGIVVDASGNVNIDSNTFYVDAANNRVGINTNTPDQSLVANGGLSVIGAGNFTGTNPSGIYLSYDSGNEGTIGARSIGTASSLIFKYSTTSSFVEGMRIRDNGHVNIGQTASGLENARSFSFQTAGAGQAVFNHSTANNTGDAWILFGYNNNSIGSITQNGTTATSYNTSSDYRLKENVTPAPDGIDRLLQLKPSRFNFIADPDRTVDGFLAHEAQAVVPECVTGEKDAVDEDGNPVFQGIDQSKLVPLLTAALQEAIAKIEALETRLSALEAA